jgi:hypothetical protein
VDEASKLSENELDDELDDAICAFDADRLRLLLRRYSVDPNRRTGTLDGGMPLLHSALDAEWHRGVNDETYVPLGDCLVALIDAGADPTVMYLGHTVLDDLRTYGAYAVMRDRAEAALQRRSGDAWLP